MQSEFVFAFVQLHAAAVNDDAREMHTSSHGFPPGKAAFKKLKKLIDYSLKLQEFLGYYETKHEGESFSFSEV